MTHPHQSPEAQEVKCVCPWKTERNLCGKKFKAVRAGGDCSNMISEFSACGHRRACHASGDSAQSMKDAGL